MAVALAALGATLRLAGPEGERTLPLTDLHRLPGTTPEVETTLRSGELVSAVALPPLRWARRSTYRKARDRASYAFALASVACALDLADAALVGSTIAKGRIAAIDAAAALERPGVLLVMTHENAPRMKPLPQCNQDPDGASVSDLPVMQDDRVHWNGQTVAVVVAEAAAEAAALVRVAYEAQDAATAFDALKAGAKAPKDVLGEDAVVEVGDPGTALSRAAVVVDATYRTPRHNHAAIEPHAVLASWEGGRLTLHDAAQLLAETRASLAKMFGLEADQVRVLSPFVGGGFGGKTMWTHQPLAAAAPKLAGRAPCASRSRAGTWRALWGGRTLTEQRVALGAAADGTLDALIHEGTTAKVPHNAFPEQFSFPSRHLYAARALRSAQKVVELDTVANASMRAPGESVGTFALGSAMDELAHALRIDPIDLRGRNEPERDPTKGTAFSLRNLRQAYAVGAERFGWDARSPEPRSRREGEWWVGMGVASAYYPYDRLPGGTARVRLSAAGRATVEVAAQEMGMGTATMQAQHAAERLGLPMEAVTFAYGDTDLPRGTQAGGSSQTVSTVAAVRAACDALVGQMLRLAGRSSPLHGAKAADMVARDGGLWRRDDPTRGEAFAAILGRAGLEELAAEGHASAPAEMPKRSMQSWGAQFCEVRVSDVTGEVRVGRFLGSFDVGRFDVGRVLNPRTAASQLRGGIIMGLAPTEETSLDDRTGRIVGTSLAEHHVPTHADVPEIDVTWTDIADPHAPLGARGIGEIGITGVGAALANAVLNATGRRVRDLPLTPDKLM